MAPLMAHAVADTGPVLFVWHQVALAGNLLVTVASCHARYGVLRNIRSKQNICHAQTAVAQTISLHDSDQSTCSNLYIYNCNIDKKMAGPQTRVLGQHQKLHLKLRQQSAICWNSLALFRENGQNYIFFRNKTFQFFKIES